MDNKRDSKQLTEESLKKGQGYNNARGEINDKKDTPKHNGQNVDNDPTHLKEKEKNEKQQVNPAHQASQKQQTSR